jgi:hypothetical protein
MSNAAGYPVDAHVHLHPRFDVASVLTVAARNMAAVAQGPAMLMLTESAGVDAFDALPEAAGPWRITETEEPVSRLARSTDGSELAIVGGRQIVTAEGLEVHALGTRRTFDDGQSVHDVLADVPQDGALAVLPWGFGKWSGARGQLVMDVIENAPPELMLADSGVRPGLMARPALLVRAETAGRKIIAGTDPLPLAREAGKAGQFGFLAKHAFDPDRPFAAVAAWLAEQRISPETYGHLESPFGFLAAQIAMQIRKRLGRVAKP